MRNWLNKMKWFFLSTNLSWVFQLYGEKKPSMRSPNQKQTEKLMRRLEAQVWFFFHLVDQRPKYAVFYCIEMLLVSSTMGQCTENSAFCIVLIIICAYEWRSHFCVCVCGVWIKFYFILIFSFYFILLFASYSFLSWTLWWQCLLPSNCGSYRKKPHARSKIQLMLIIILLLMRWDHTSFPFSLCY